MPCSNQFAKKAMKGRHRKKIEETAPSVERSSGERDEKGGTKTTNLEKTTVQRGSEGVYKKSIFTKGGMAKSRTGGKREGHNRPGWNRQCVRGELVF